MLIYVFDFSHLFFYLQELLVDLWQSKNISPVCNSSKKKQFQLVSYSLPKKIFFIVPIRTYPKSNIEDFFCHIF